MSRVKNVLVNDVEVFQEELVQELISKEIGYVQIENEFHFLDSIYRIYDLQTIAKLYLSLPKIDLVKLEDYIIVSENRTLPNLLSFNDVTDCYVPYIEFQEEFNFCKTNHSTKLNKHLIKQQNRQVNKIINKK